MIERIINDINKALGAEAYMAALSLALTLPDICAKAEYGDTLGNKVRYIKWYNEYIGQYEKASTSSNLEVLPYLSGEVLYQLRCSVLHQGTPNIDGSKIDEECCKIDNFALIIEKARLLDIYVDCSSVYQPKISLYGLKQRSYNVNVRRLCCILMSAAQSYYNQNKVKFDFFKYTIIDLEDQCQKIKNPGEH